MLNLRGKVDFDSVSGDIIEFISDSTTEWTEIRRSESTGSPIQGFEADLTLIVNTHTNAQAKQEVAGQSHSPALTILANTSSAAVEDTT